jgi:NAD(P)-dependent dehydrogenase (short-subunit alcohol dehydrogenase family)
MQFSLEMFRLDGQVAIVTGAGGRGNSIGRAYALGLAEAGASVVVADLRLEGAQTVAEEINVAGGHALAVQVDIADRASVAQMVEQARAGFGGVDILVNNAALMVDTVKSRTIDYPPDAWANLFAVNLTGALNCSHAVVDLMCARGGGKIINQGSSAAYPAKTAYGITKTAIAALTTTLAAELGKQGINVNAIAPGSVATDARNSLVAGLPASHRQAMEAQATLRYEGHPHELVGALLLLCSAAGAWIHGQVLHVDGGMTM